MANSSIRKQTKNYLSYIGLPIVEMDSISVMHSIGRKPLKIDLHNPLNTNTDIDNSFHNQFNDFIKSNPPINEIIYQGLTQASNLIEYKNLYSGLERIAQVFNNNPEIGNSHYIFLLDTYIRLSGKKNITTEQQSKFIELFDIKKMDEKYMALIAIATDNKVLLNMLSKQNHEFSQDEYIYSKVFKRNDIIYNKPVVYAADVEYLLLHSAIELSHNLFPTLLSQFVSSSQDNKKLKSILNKDHIVQKMGFDDIATQITMGYNIENSLKHVDKYQNFLDLNEKIIPKNKKENKNKI